MFLCRKLRKCICKLGVPANHAACHYTHTLIFDNNRFCRADLCALAAFRTKLHVKHRDAINNLHSALLLAHLYALHTLNTFSLSSHRLCLAGETKVFYLGL